MRKSWFKRKKWGWGWTPATWEGWLITLLFIGTIVRIFLRADSTSHSVSDTLISFVPETLVLFFLLVVVCILTDDQWRPSSFRGRLGFAFNYVRHPLQNASVIPSSRFASRAMLDGIDFWAIDVVVELGPGTGVFTEEILKRCKPGTVVILIEIEREYVEALRQRFGSKVVVEHASAQYFDILTAKHTNKKIDLIVSGLPVHVPAIKEKLFEAIRKQTEQGAIYRFFSYVPPLVWREYKNLPVRKISFVFRNFPPMWIFGIN